MAPSFVAGRLLAVFPFILCRVLKLVFVEMVLIGLKMRQTASLSAAVSTTVNQECIGLRVIATQ